MTLANGTRFGSYEVQALIGVGGMGEVYRARDPKLGRDVALKVVSGIFVGDAERAARFEREAKLLASLNHASIAAIYGLEESAGQRAIVMELVDGRELAGPLPLSEALQVARQIAEGLEFAHERGVIHRDLKPANLRVTAEGAVKILDFGLAKALTTGIEPTTDTAIAVSPALSLAATQAGMLLGTAAYMAPEQAKGRAADRRADIWAFGVVLYELLTGKRLFDGETVAETLASVMKEPITLVALPAETPRAIRTLLERCLERDPKRRLQSIGEARIAIEDVLAGRSGDESRAANAAPAAAVAWPATAATALLIAIGAVTWAVWGGRATEATVAAPVVGHFALALPDSVVFGLEGDTGPNFALSPDGRSVAFVAEALGERRTLWVRALGSLQVRRLERTEGAYFPFWSPDSQHVGYFANNKLMRIAAAGGAPLTLADVTAADGGSWGRTEEGDDAIVFAPGPEEPVLRVPAMGGIATPVTTLAADELRHLYPQLLPGGRLLYTAAGASSATYVQTLGTAERTLLPTGGARTAYVPPGILLHVREGVLLGQRFDLDTLALAGEPVAITENVRSESGFSRRSAFAASAGAVLYRGGTVGASTRVRWYERDGTPGEIVLEPGDYRHLELSPDGRLLAIAVEAGAGTRDLWVKDLANSTFQRLTSSPGTEAQQVWSPDSRRLAFTSAEGIAYSEVGSGQWSPLPGAPGLTLLQSWTPDGAYLLAGGRTLRLVPAPGSAEAAASAPPREVFNADYSIDHVRVSPDGRWVAYTSQESERGEVMVAAFPSFTNRRPISVAGGTQPQWRADGKELFFHASDQRLMAVDVATGDTFEAGPPRELFRTNPMVVSDLIFMYAAAPDGQRFLLVEPVQGTASANESLYVLTNWTALLDAN